MSPRENFLALRLHTLESWGLRDMPPFRGVPPTDIDELLRVFVDREDEIKRALGTLDGGENILVRGMMGIGKTAFIMTTLHEIGWQAGALDRPVLTVHLRQFAGSTRDDFYRAVLYGIARQMAPSYKRAREIVRAMTGEEITRGRKLGLSAGVEVQVPQVFAVKGTGEVGGDESQVLRIKDPRHFVDELLDVATRKKGFRRVVVALDDIERCSNQGNIKTMLYSSLDLIRDSRCAFVLTGRTLTIMEDAYSSGLDIFNETISLKPLTHEQLRSIAVKTLNLVREHPDETSTHPLSDEAVEAIASKSFGIPRRFVLLCEKMLKMALEAGIAVLNQDAFGELFEHYQDELAESDVPPDIRRILYLGLQQGGFSISKDADLDQVFDILGISTMTQFVEFADDLVQQELLQRTKDNRGEILYRLVAGVEKLASSGEKLL